jgi:ABC-type amino acid transport substrate-binding protein/F0F1-type ATP synthase membrane subunit b/b'
MKGRLRGQTLFAALLVLWPLRLEAAAQTTPLRLCADPDNLPFSSENGATPGIYVELGREIAAALGRPFEPVWAPTYYEKRVVRMTLLAGLCDGFIGLPDDPRFMGRRLIFSKPIMRVGYALVAPPAMAIRGLADLDGRRVVVQFGSPPQDLLAERDKVRMVTVLSPEEGMRDLVARKADAAFISGPSAGWINRSQLHDAYKVVPIEGPYMQWEVAIAFPRGREDLRDALDRALTGLATKTAELMAKYGFPNAKPTRLAESSGPNLGGGTDPVKKAAAIPAALRPAANAKEIAANIVEASAAKAEAERELHQVEAKIARLDQDLAEMREEAKRNWAAESERLYASGVAEIEKINQAARAELAASERAAQQQVREIAASMAVERAAALVSSKMNTEIRARMFQSFLQELGKGTR